MIQNKYPNFSGFGRERKGVYKNLLHKNAYKHFHVEKIRKLLFEISECCVKFCPDGIEEDLRPGVMHICPKGSKHSIVNTGEEDLVMLTIVVKK